MHFSGEESANGRKGYAMLLIFTGQQAFVFFKETTEGNVIGKAHLLRQFLDGDIFFLQQKFLGQGDPAAVAFIFSVTTCSAGKPTARVGVK